MSHTQANVILGKQRGLGACDSFLLLAWTPMVCSPVFSLGHRAHGLQEGASHSCLPGDAFPGGLTSSPRSMQPWQHGPWLCGLYTQAPGGLKLTAAWGQAKLPGWGLRLLSRSLQAPKNCTLNWSRNSWPWLLSWSCWGDGIWDRSPPFSQIRSTWIEHLSFFTIICLMSLAFVVTGSQPSIFFVRLHDQIISHFKKTTENQLGKNPST